MGGDKLGLFGKAPDAGCRYTTGVAVENRTRGTVLLATGTKGFEAIAGGAKRGRLATGLEDDPGYL